MKTKTIERRSGVTYDTFVREHLLPRRPVILTDAMDDCPAREKWTPDYLRRRVGHRLVPTDAGPMRMADVIDGIKQPRGTQRPPFLRERPVPWILPELLPDLRPFPVYAGPNWFEYPFAQAADPFRCGFGGMLLRLAQTDMNITGPGVAFPYLHLDRFRCHAMILQWHGRKEFFVFAPDQTARLYPDESGALSLVNDVEKPDLERFPQFADIEMHRAVLNPGESLFNPTGWWHTTRTQDPSIATVISFANASNWDECVRAMVPQRASGRARFSLFHAYLKHLGRHVLPTHTFADPSRPDTARRQYEHFLRICGSWFPTSWEISSAFCEPDADWDEVATAAAGGR
jgi:histone arginine demethylase JMJD6